MYDAVGVLCHNYCIVSNLPSSYIVCPREYAKVLCALSLLPGEVSMPQLFCNVKISNALNLKKE